MELMEIFYSRGNIRTQNYGAQQKINVLSQGLIRTI